MFTKSQEEFLLRRLQRNEVVLFVGAGFALEAQNKFKENLPTGKQLANKIWNFLKMPGAYDDTALQTMYELLLNKGVKTQSIKDLMNDIFSVKEYPDYYNNLTLPFWHKIYTTNIDNLLDKIYFKSGQKPIILKYPKDEHKDVDKTLETIQLVYLNGKLPCEPNELIFSRKQYARNLNALQPLYHQFVNDYATTTTIFLGTSIDEPIFEQYIAARETRASNVTEYRPQSFLIDPFISAARADVLRNLYNIEPIQATTQDFLQWLSNNQSHFLDKIETLKITFPSFAELVTKASAKTIHDLGESFNDFSLGFTKVNPFGTAQSKSKNFLLGTSPTWSDIYNDLDAPRKITKVLFDSIEQSYEKENDKLKVFALLGSAGCGKSTILKRLALQLAQNGRTVFLSYSEYIPDYNSIVNTVNTFKQKVVLFFDNADLMLQQLPSLIEELQKCNIPPVILISTRTNVFDRLTSKLESIVNLTEFNTPNLDRDEIIEIIQVLEQNNLLGHLKGMSKADRIKEFEQRAKKQILVAMREATKGDDFNKIISSEFKELVPPEARFLTACVALTTEAGFTISKQDFIGFSDASPAETLYYLERNLRDVVIRAGVKQDRLLLRHRAIADYIIDNCLDTETLKIVYLRILSSLAPEINVYDWKSRKFSLYREIINHYKIYKRFKNNISSARDLYESLMPFFSSDYQFWLQYGSLELEGKGGNLELAQNYLLQAQSLKPNSLYVKNAVANMYFKMSIASKSPADSITYREEANKIMHAILEDENCDDAHTYHIYCKGNYNYVINKMDNLDLMKSELERLKKVIKKGLGSHPVNRRLQQVSDVIDKAYLLTSVMGKIEFPTLLTEFE
jgi:hypothetical protein